MELLIGEAENWANEEEVKKYYPSKDLVPKIRALFKKWKEEKASDLMPIEHLAKEFKSILLDH